MAGIEREGPGTDRRRTGGYGIGRHQAGFALPLAIRFFLATALLIVLAVSAAIVVTYVQGKRIADRAIGKTLTTSEAAQREFEQHRLEQLELSLRLVASDASFVKYIADANSSPATCRVSAATRHPTPCRCATCSATGRRTSASASASCSTARATCWRGPIRPKRSPNPWPATRWWRRPWRETRPLSGYWRLDAKLYQAAIVPLGAGSERGRVPACWRRPSTMRSRARSPRSAARKSRSGCRSAASRRWSRPRSTRRSPTSCARPSPRAAAC